MKARMLFFSGCLSTVVCIGVDAREQPVLITTTAIVTVGDPLMVISQKDITSKTDVFVQFRDDNHLMVTPVISETSIPQLTFTVACKKIAGGSQTYQVRYLSVGGLPASWTQVQDNVGVHCGTVRPNTTDASYTACHFLGC